MTSDEVRIASLETRALLAAKELPFAFELIAGAAGVHRPITHPRIQKPGLALVGHFDGVVATRVQILGETEVSFLHTMDNDRQRAACEAFFGRTLSCVIVTAAEGIPESVVAAAESQGVALLRSPVKSSTTIGALHALLDERLAPRTKIHGVFVDVYGVGIMLVGKSGIGKSECALELVQRGHRLVADDVVECMLRPPDRVYGASSALLENHLEVRGLGVLNIKDLFGVAAVRKQKRLELIVQLISAEDGDDWDRLGLDEETETVLGATISRKRLPVRPGKNTAIVVEVAARNELLLRAGIHSARAFHARLSAALGVGGK